MNKHQTNTAKPCGSCRAPVVWLKTAAGKSMPCDAATVGAEDRQYDHAKHTSHFATCPNAAKHRKPKAQTRHARRPP